MRQAFQLHLCEMTAAERLPVKNNFPPSHQTRSAFYLSPRFGRTWIGICHKHIPPSVAAQACGFLFCVQLYSRSGKWLKSRSLLLFLLLRAFFTAAAEKPRWSLLPCNRTRHPQTAPCLDDFCKRKLTPDGLPVRYKWDVRTAPAQRCDFPLQ